MNRIWEFWILVVEEDTVRVRFLADLIRKELIQKVREQYYPCPISIQFGYHELNTTNTNIQV